MLTLSPHDLRCDQDILPQHTIAQANWHGGRWDLGVGGISLQNDRRVVVCQRWGGPLLCLTNLGDLNHIHGSTDSIGELASPVPTDPSGFRMDSARAFAHARWGRGFFLNEHFQLRRSGEQAHSFLLVSPHRWAMYRELTPLNPKSPDGKTTRFIWSAVDERDTLQDLPASQIVERLKVQIDDPTSDFHFAKPSHEEITNLLWSCKRFNIAAMKHTLRCALLAQTDFWKSKSGLTWEISLDNPAEPSSRIYSDAYEFLEIPPSLAETIRRVLHFFQPQFNQGKQRQHLCLHFSTASNVWLAFHISSPTAHEVLEANLQWRDWLADNSPDDK